MRSHELGFISSWKMLTRDKGWIKPLLVLTLVSWIPILGQIAVLGYGLEWARLTAWGVDSAPKQRGVKYGKVLSTGGIAFLVAVSMAIVLGVVNVILFGGLYVGAAFPLLSGATMSGVVSAAGANALFGGVSLASILLMVVVNAFFGTFITAAMMRSTVYDSFSAGWRVDRLFQMAVRDIGGFLHTYAVSLIGSIVSGLVAGLVTLIGVLIASASVLFLAYHTPGDGRFASLGSMLMGLGAFPVLVIVILAIAAFFAVQVIGVAMQLISINAMGQWFCRYDVNRWGVSSAPLPDGTPRDFSGFGGAWSTSCPPVEPDMPHGAAGHPAETPAVAAAPAEPVGPSDAASPTAGTAAPAGEVSAEVAPTEKAPDAASETSSADSPVPGAAEPRKQAIPLGPITSGDRDGGEEGGSIQA